MMPLPAYRAVDDLFYLAVIRDSIGERQRVLFAQIGLRPSTFNTEQWANLSGKDLVRISDKLLVTHHRGAILQPRAIKQGGVTLPHALAVGNKLLSIDRNFQVLRRVLLRRSPLPRRMGQLVADELLRDRLTIENQIFRVRIYFPQVFHVQHTLLELIEHELAAADWLAERLQ